MGFSENIHASLIKNSTDMQGQLLNFSNELSNLSLKALENQTDFRMQSFGDFTSKIDEATDKLMYHEVVIKLGKTTDTQKTIKVQVSPDGIPKVTEDDSATEAQKAVAKAMAVVGFHLKGLGLTKENVTEIFKSGITPTSLAAVQSQTKGHHDAVLQLALESLSRVTNILQKIAQKLGS